MRQVARRPCDPATIERLDHQRHARAVLRRDAVALAKLRPGRAFHEPSIEKGSDLRSIRVERAERQEVPRGSSSHGRLDACKQGTGLGRRLRVL